MNIIGVLIFIAWFVVRIAGAKKRQDHSSTRPPNAAQRSTGQPMPNKTGTWADMLGIPTEGASELDFGGMLGKLNDALQLPMNPPKESAPSLKPVAASVFEPLPAYEYESMEGKSYAKEGVDDCHEYMLEPTQSTLTFETPSLEAPTETARAPEWTLAFDAPALVQGVLYAEILERPVQRWRGRR